jgi:hypothetical protein
MESHSDYPHIKAWEPPPPQANDLSPNKPPTHHAPSPRKVSLKMTLPNGGKKINYYQIINLASDKGILQ